MKPQSLVRSQNGENKVSVLKGCRHDDIIIFKTPLTV